MELCGEDGRSVETQPVRMHDNVDPKTAAVVTFEQPMPMSTKVCGLRILKGEKVLYEATAAAPAPRLSGLVVIVERNRAKVTWRAASSAPRLWHKVRYSPDDGKTWLSVKPRLSSASATLDLRRLPGGGRCRVEVYTSDGLQTGRARSRAFTVPHKPPRAIIATPATGVRLRSRAVRLLGAGLDDGGRAIPNERLVWRSNRDGDLGTGGVVDAVLSSGRHRLALHVTDADGRAGRAVANVTVA